MKEAFIKGSHGDIWYRVHNPDASGIPLLVLHGGPGFLSMSDEIEELADERPVFFYDQLGCGRSSSQSNPDLFTVENYVRELDVVIRSLKLSPCHILAQSWGTMLAVEYMLSHKSNAIERLILSGPLLSTILWEKDQRSHIANMAPEVRAIIDHAEKCAEFGEDYEQAMMAFYKKHVCRLDPWPDSLMDAFGKLNMDVYGAMWGRSEFTVTGSLKNADLTPYLEEITIPVLLTCGEHDEAGIETVKTYRDAFANPSMAVIPGTSHLHHLEQPLIFRTIMREFLADRLKK